MSAGNHLNTRQFHGPRLTEDDAEILHKDSTEGEAEGLHNPDIHDPVRPS